MRFMVLVKANTESEAGVLPDQKTLAAMAEYNEELVKAGIILAADGLHASSKGARVKFDGTKRTVIDGPFAETKELIAGYWLWQVRSREEALSPAAERARRPSRETRPRRRSSTGVRASSVAYAQRTRAGAAPRACSRLRKFNDLIDTSLSTIASCVSRRSLKCRPIPRVAPAEDRPQRIVIRRKAILPAVAVNIGIDCDEVL